MIRVLVGSSSEDIRLQSEIRIVDAISA